MTFGNIQLDNNNNKRKDGNVLKMCESSLQISSSTPATSITDGKDTSENGHNVPFLVSICYLLTCTSLCTQSCYCCLFYDIPVNILYKLFCAFLV
jgi:hypothetical protein